MRHHTSLLLCTTVERKSFTQQTRRCMRYTLSLHSCETDVRADCCMSSLYDLAATKQSG